MIRQTKVGTKSAMANSATKMVTTQPPIQFLPSLIASPFANTLELAEPPILVAFCVFFKLKPRLVMRVPHWQVNDAPTKMLSGDNLCEFVAY